MAKKIGLFEIQKKRKFENLSNWWAGGYVKKSLNKSQISFKFDFTVSFNCLETR
jgi:hypothetical protein